MLPLLLGLGMLGRHAADARVFWQALHVRLSFAGYVGSLRYFFHCFIAISRQGFYMPGSRHGAVAGAAGGHCQILHIL